MGFNNLIELKKPSERAKKHLVRVKVESEELYVYSYSDFKTFAQQHSIQQVGSSNNNLICIREEPISNPGR
jgi:hypothetical protein